MSRRVFLDRLKGVGVGFGAVAVAGTAASAHTNDTAVGLTSTNTALGKIVEEGKVDQAAAEVEGNPEQHAQYYWRYRRYFYRRYRRFYYRRVFYRRRYW